MAKEKYSMVLITLAEQQRMLEEVRFNVSMRIREMECSDGFDDLDYNELRAQRADLDEQIEDLDSKIRAYLKDDEEETA